LNREIARGRSSKSFIEEIIVSIIRVGSNKKYSDGWEAAFSGKKKQSGQKSTAKKKTAKKAKK
jgi:hypothetical protein